MSAHLAVKGELGRRRRISPGVPPAGEADEASARDSYALRSWVQPKPDTSAQEEPEGYRILTLRAPFSVFCVAPEAPPAAGEPSWSCRQCSEARCTMEQHRAEMFPDERAKDNSRPDSRLHQDVR
jgi:hypothetical protein